MPVKCGFSESTRDILPTIGAGEISIQNQGGLEFLNRRIGSHVGTTNSECANLDANVPISDMVEFVQSKLNASSMQSGVSLSGDELTKNIEEDKETSRDKWNNAKADFIAKLDETFGSLPNNLSNEDSDRLAKVRETIEEKYDDIALKESEKEKIVAITYNLSKLIDEHPEAKGYAGIQLALAPVAGAAFGSDIAMSIMAGSTSALSNKFKICLLSSGLSI